MIRVHQKRNGYFYVNPHQVKMITANPDTKLILMNGEMIFVDDTVEEVVASIEAYEKRIYGKDIVARASGE